MRFTLVSQGVLPLLVASGLGSALPNQNTRACRAPSGPPPGRPVDVDVAIVGGGFSGMASAYRLHKQGLKVVVLEATDKLGGRSRSHPLETGPGLVELGATWINNDTQRAVGALADEFGLELIEQYREGVGMRQLLDGTMIVEGGDDGSEEEEVDEEFALAMQVQEDFLEELARVESATDIEDFYSFPVEDDVSFDAWVRRNESWDNPLILAVAAQLTTGIVGREPKDVGAHYWFDYLNSGNGWQSLLGDDEEGAQRQMIKTGTTSIVANIRDALPKDSVLTQSPVTNIAQEKDTVVLTTSTGAQWRAKKAIVAIMPSTYAKITFTPPLPDDKRGLVAASQEGHYAKILISYAAPWWRDANLTGQFFSYTGPITYSLETSVPALDQYSLACFVAGDFALEWFNLTDAGKEEAVVEHLATMAGEELAQAAREYVEINYVAWTEEEWIGGGPTNSMGPGMLRRYGETLRATVGPLHFAGTETAYKWKGYLEGAVTAGHRAADEVVEALGVKGQ